uniref:Uncharacterized protein n=1 Tax=Zea mays TaxID=4577 RepID=A0A804N2F1_MAIZE
MASARLLQAARSQWRSSCAAASVLRSLSASLSLSAQYEGCIWESVAERGKNLKPLGIPVFRRQKTVASFRKGLAMLPNSITSRNNIHLSIRLGRLRQLHPCRQSQLEC